MNYTFGLIGTGNMGAALAKAAEKALAAEQMILADRSLEKARELAESLGCMVGENEIVAKESQFLFLGVKPHMVASLLDTLKPTLEQRKTPPVLVSMAAGVTIAKIQEMAGRDYPVIRIMPNTPVAEGVGAILYAHSESVSDTVLLRFTEILSAAGKLLPLEESLIDAGSAVSGCGPAFVYLFVDAMADGGVACGLSRNDALEFAAQTVLGAAQMILSTEKHPEQLKNDVCSPGGSTIQGVRTLEQRALRAAVMDAVISAYEKTKELGKS